MNFMDRIVIKIGSRVLTQIDGQLNEDVIAHLVKDVAMLKEAGKKIVIVSSGAVSCGRMAEELRGNFSVDAGNQNKTAIREQILASIGQPTLMSIYISEFEKHSIKCAQALVTRADFADRHRYLSMRTVTENMFNLGIVPIFNENDFLSPKELDFSDNDQLACMITAMLGAERLIILTNVDGVYDRSPNDAGAKLLSEITDIGGIISKIKSSTSVGGKGGMRSKLSSAELITTLGTPMHIANGFTKDVVSRIILRNERIGTFFPAAGEKIEPLKTWLTIAAASSGKIIVSTYLADILRRKQFASILLAGIDDVQGHFEKNEVVSVCDVDGTELGRGQCRYSSNQLRDEVKLRKESFSEGAKIEGGEKIAIHYNYFVFN